MSSIWKITYHEDYFIKEIRNEPTNIHGENIPIDLAIENERRAIKYMKLFQYDPYKLFPKTEEIKIGTFKKEKLKELVIHNITINSKIIFSNALLNALERGYGFEDSIEIMADENGELKICNADSFINFGKLPRPKKEIKMVQPIKRVKEAMHALGLLEGDIPFSDIENTIESLKNKCLIKND